MSDDAQDPATDARWLAHRFDFRQDSYQFVFMPRETHRETAFLNEQHIAPELERRTVPRREAAAAPKDRVPLHFIFHSGLTCSTLLARALDREGTAMTLKEPAILTDIVAHQVHGATPAATQAARGDALDLLARPFAPGEPVIVKTASVANGLSQAILDSRPDSQALCLYAPLPVFLGSIARKGLMGRLWGRRLFIGLRNARMVDLGFTDQEYFSQTDLQIAAAAWLAQQAMFARLVARFGPGRVRSIESETFTEQPAEALGALAEHFRLALAQDDVRAIVGGPVFRLHSKTGEEFDLDRRTGEIRDSALVHADEIEKVCVWAGKVAEAAGFSARLEAPLLAGR